MTAPLRRVLSVTSCAALVVSNMIGTGIFTTTGFLAGDLGRPLLVLGIWVVGGIVALAGCHGVCRAGDEHSASRRGVRLPAGGLGTRLGVPERLGFVLCGIFRAHRGDGNRIFGVSGTLPAGAIAQFGTTNPFQLAAHRDSGVGEHRRDLSFCGDQYTRSAPGGAAAGSADRGEAGSYRCVSDCGVWAGARRLEPFPSGDGEDFEPRRGGAVCGVADLRDVCVQRMECGELRGGGDQRPAEIAATWLCCWGPEWLRCCM